MQNQPHVSVVVVTFEREACLLKTLEDLLNQTYSAYDVTVVDQNERPYASLLAFAVSAGERLRIAHLRPPNVCVARNLGLRATRGEIVLYVDDDIRCGPTFVAEHVAPYQDAEVGGVGGWIDARTRKFTWQPDERFVAAPIGCNMSFRRTALEEAGGFNPYFHSVPAYGEENDLAHRVRHAGYRIVTAPKALVFHDLSPSGGQRARDPERYWQSYTVNFVLLFRRTKPWFQQLLFGVWIFKLWWTVNRLSGGRTPVGVFGRGVREGVALARRSDVAGRFLEAVPEPQWVDPLAPGDVQGS